MELNRDTIIKALECCTSSRCKECAYFLGNGRCKSRQMQKDAVALIKEQEQKIKELTEEKERLRGVGIPDNEVYIRLSDAKHAIMEYACNRTVSQYASAEICKAVRNGVEGAMNELDYITPVKVAPIADTVRNMEQKLNDRIEGRLNYHGWYLKETIFPKIAQEVLEGKDDNA